MEACMRAHFDSRMLREFGFEPRIFPAIYVNPFNKGQKNDYNDAEAIAEAAMRPPFLPISSPSKWLPAVIACQSSPPVDPSEERERNSVRMSTLESIGPAGTAVAAVRAAMGTES